MRVQGKARGGEKKGSIPVVVCEILSLFATPPWGIRRIFEIAYGLTIVQHTI
jgi:hypothetical protein